jgi:hypothetical protein
VVNHFLVFHIDMKNLIRCRDNAIDLALHVPEARGRHFDLSSPKEPGKALSANGAQISALDLRLTSARWPLRLSTVPSGVRHAFSILLPVLLANLTD